jgi:pyridoxamine 5'-phosphate oxidase
MAAHLRDVEAASDPLIICRQWIEAAVASEPNDPNAAALATADPSGAPSVRMVLVKQIDNRGFCFYTNSESRKGQELAMNPYAALCFHWKSLQRQIRVEGPVVELPPADADDYFHSRSRGSQLGAAVSQQSRALADRHDLEQLVAQYAAETPGEIPRPAWWKGYAIQPQRIEFWMAGDDRLHDRIQFALTEGGGWRTERLFP